jgi:glutamate 5-kinase
MRPRPAPGSIIVIKVGSSSLAAAGGGLDEEAVDHVVSQVEAVWGQGHPTVLVTSGAVAAGLPVMGNAERPGDLAGLQVAAAVGQGRLMERYATQFGARDRVVGQVLLTRDVLARREQYLHAREALQRMLGLGIVPIVNENDTVVVDELKLGDNDRLAAIVAHLVSAGMLIILTDTAGLYSDDPRLTDEAELLTVVRHTDEILDQLERRSGSGALGSGGVATKISAARMAAWSGIPTVIAAAFDETAALAAVSGEDVGTWIKPHDSKLTAKKLWIAFGLRAGGRLMIDAGAVAALTERGGSLLAAGVTNVDGEFAAGSAVEVITGDGALVGKGLAGLSATELRAALGSHSSQAGGEAIHRDDLVVLA